MITAARQVELPPLKGFYRTPFGFYVANHKAPAEKTWGKTAEWLYREGTPPIPNTYWSRVATLTKEELAAIEDPVIRKETEQAQELMLEYPAQFVGLMAVGNQTLIEPHGFGVKELPHKLRQGHIEVYDHDVGKIAIGEPQTKYNNARLWVDESAKEGEVRYAVRGGDWGAGGRRFGVNLDYDPRDSGPVVAGLGFRPEGNQAYVDVGEALKSIAGANQLIEQAERELC